MEQKLEEITKESQEEADEYFKFIKSSVANGSYFKDAVNWYFFRYVTPICDRTMLIFGAILAAVVLYFLVQMVQSAFPLVEEVPVFIRAQDQSVSFPNLVALKPRKGHAGYDPSVKTVDEAIAKYLLETYVQDREGFDFSKAEIADVNNKFNRVRNTSSAAEYRIFQLIMSKDNPDSPINHFGQPVSKIVEIESVKLVKNEPKNFASKAREYLINKIPTEAEVRFSTVTIIKSVERSTPEEIRDRYIVKVTFAFDGVSKEGRGMLNFNVNGYKLYKVK